MSAVLKSFLCLAVLFLIGCSGVGEESLPSVTPTPSPTPTPTPGAYAIDVSWTANREKDVNSTGGGYLVYYATSAGVDTTTADFVDVPYVSGASAPTTTTISNLAVGTYYIRVVAYSAYNPNSTPGGNRSADSAEFSVTLTH